MEPAAEVSRGGVGTLILLSICPASTLGLRGREEAAGPILGKHTLVPLSRNQGEDKSSHGPQPAAWSGSGMGWAGEGQ